LSDHPEFPDMVGEGENAGLSFGQPQEDNLMEQKG
jgi:hypothetical protein